MFLIYFQVRPGLSALDLRLAAALALDLFPAMGRATAVQTRARMTAMRILTESIQTTEYKRMKSYLAVTSRWREIEAILNGTEIPPRLSIDVDVELLSIHMYEREQQMLAYLTPD